MLGAKRPHLSLIDYDDAAGRKLRARIKELGLELVCIAAIMILRQEWINREFQMLRFRLFISENWHVLAHDLGTIW